MSQKHNGNKASAALIFKFEKKKEQEKAMHLWIDVPINVVNQRTKHSLLPSNPGA